ncbi:hypothetical protein L7F22_018921 [Adiantum nelumboides]|nr:hypothetical protein [Adiantum nelumboides]
MSATLTTSSGADIGRPSTPPNHGGSSSAIASSSQMTPENIRIMRENRLRAKARIQQQAAAQNPEARLSMLGKRKPGPIRLDAESTDNGLRNKQMTMIGPNGNVIKVTPSTTRNANLDASATHISPNKAKQSSLLAAGAIEDPNAPLPRDKSLGNYIEFDLSKIQNSKGGFLIDDEDDSKTQKTLQELRAERERMRERMREGMQPGINLADDIKCRECGSRDVSEELRTIFKLYVCKACEKRYPEKYSLLTKTEVKEDYLLTDSELKDPDLLPHILKANPHKSTFSNMMLYLRIQVEQYAFSDKKWGSEQGLDDEFNRRETEKARRRESKFIKGLADLRKKTRNNVWEKRQEKRHQCNFETVEDIGTQKKTKKCVDCGFEVEVEDL